MTDVDQYKTYREVGTQLNSDILEAYSDRELIVETAEELGIETEREMLEATTAADPSLFEVESVSDSGPRLTVTDLLNDREHTLVDVNLSRIAEPGVVLCFRPVRYDEFTTTSGVSFPFPGDEKASLLDEQDRRVDPDESRSVSRQRFVVFHDLYRDRGIHIQYR